MPNPIRQRAIDGLNAGDTFAVSRTFTQEETALFGDITRDYNPAHYDLRWTEAKKFKGLICHGLIVGSMICEFGGQVGWLATGMNFKFIKPVYFGDTITCKVTINRIEEKGRAEAEAIFTNQTGEQVCLAFLTGRVPLEPEREILRQMVAEGDPTNKLA
ncbi:MAG: MaoC family dehydratase [Deltaproteobacteria bacterium]|nr:MaoC family dehydratase [Deltaproteobacteria bacterium]